MSNENKIWKFPAGEVGVTYFVDKNETRVDLHLRNASSDEVMKVLLQANAIHHAAPGARINLVAPYLPYGRQDRVSAPGTSFSLEAFAKMLGTGDFNRITVVDAHSPVTVSELKKHFPIVIEYHAFQFVDLQVVDSIPYDDWANVVILAPDKGAVERAQQCADVLGIPSNVHYAEKVRDPATGEILGIEAKTIEAHHHVLIIDDICDGGRTFIELAKAINCASKTLYVTHGIFSKGYQHVAEHFNAVWTTDSLKNDEVPEDRIIHLNTYINW